MAVNQTVHFTDLVVGHSHLAMLGFASFAAAGGLVHVWQRIGWARYNARARRSCLLAACVGVVMMVVGSDDRRLGAGPAVAVRCALARVGAGVAAVLDGSHAGGGAGGRRVHRAARRIDHWTSRRRPARRSKTASARNPCATIAPRLAPVAVEVRRERPATGGPLRMAYLVASVAGVLVLRDVSRRYWASGRSVCWRRSRRRCRPRSARDERERTSRSCRLQPRGLRLLPHAAGSVPARRHVSASARRRWRGRGTSTIRTCGARGASARICRAPAGTPLRGLAFHAPVLADARWSPSRSCRPIPALFDGARRPSAAGGPRSRRVPRNPWPRARDRRPGGRGPRARGLQLPGRRDGADGVSGRRSTRHPARTRRDGVVPAELIRPFVRRRWRQRPAARAAALRRPLRELSRQRWRRRRTWRQPRCCLARPILWSTNTRMRGSPRLCGMALHGTLDAGVARPRAGRSGRGRGRGQGVQRDATCSPAAGEPGGNQARVYTPPTACSATAHKATVRDRRPPS